MLSRALAPALLILGLVTAPSALAQLSAATGPDPELSPSDVVRAQLAGFQADSDAGIAQAFAFASPRNRSVTGPVQRFTDMIRAGYGELLGHRSADLAELRQDEAHTYQGVEITAADGRTHLYVFILSRYDLPNCSNCWMTDGVAKRPANPDAQSL
ncbi:MAG: DUF4864 domain-containing protein [Algiphilus sp.]|uniref:DUF4864 domain-containing protein n=1 Tax=Algiphilus sp. TaxID=1872431 RepID=UPI0032EF094C